MTTRRARWTIALLAGVSLCAGCAAGGGQKPAAASSGAEPTAQLAVSSGASSSAAAPTSSAPSPTSPPPTSIPAASGSSAAAAVAVLPAGRGTGPVTITYDGLGQDDTTFVGQCSHAGSATTLSGTADTATIDLVFDPSSVTLTVTDVGLGTSKAALTRLDLTVVGGRLALKAPLVSAGEVIGSVSMDVTCSA